MVHVCGIRDAIAETGEQLAWLGAALRSSQYESGVSYCAPVIYATNTTTSEALSSPESAIHFQFKFLVEKVGKKAEPLNGQCWHSLFRNPLVVKGFPIPRRREHDYGLEIPLNMMADLTGTHRANMFKDKLFIKSFSTMLVPTEHKGDLLIWHLLYNEDGSRISYLDNPLSHAVNVNFSTLEISRHVLGWCSKVKNCAGRNYEKIVKE